MCFVLRPAILWPAVVFVVTTVGMAAGERLFAAESTSLRGISFRSRIAPLLLAKCEACHGERVAKGEFRLDTYERLRAGGESGDTVIVSGKPQESYLVELLRSNDVATRMPLDGPPLKESDVALLEKWIAEGAHYDGDDPKLPLVEAMTPPTHPDPPAKYSQPLPITAIAFRPDGKELAVGGFHEVMVWDVATGKLQRRIKNVASRTYALVYSAKHDVLAVGSGNPGEYGEVRLFDPRDGRLIRTVATFGDAVMDLRLSPDESLLAVASADRTIRIFEMPAGKRRTLLTGHGDIVTSIAFSPDGKRLAAVSLDRAAKVYDLTTNKAVTTYTEHELPLYCVTFTDDGKFVLSGGKEKKIHRWSVVDGKRAGEMVGLGGETLKLLVSGEDLFMGGSGKQVRQYVASDLKQVRAFKEVSDWIYSLAAHAPSRLVASGSFDGEVCISDATDGKELARFTAVP